jgi:hypothetical protein
MKISKAKSQKRIKEKFMEKCLIGGNKRQLRPEKASGEPTLMTHSPTLVWLEFPKASGYSLQSASILITA